MTDPLLAACGVRVEFPGGRRPADGLDLAVHPGEIVALAGQSGCGKTTLIRAMLGLQRTVSGEIRYEGRPIGRGRALRRYRRHVQFIPQDPRAALDPRRTVYDAVAEGLRAHRLRDGEYARVTEALDLAGLPRRLAASRPYELSGGQCQRVLIAGALVLRPRVLLADEPVSSLDVVARGEILALLLRLREELGMATLIATHDLGAAWQIADRTAVLHGGRIAEDGPTECVLTRPAHEQTRTLLAAHRQSAPVHS
ncbi:MAG: hypothetical protein QOD41_785 [Cryptosporangiaceae bacterium]|nr:hypothetical protein [Cryptosporangiaceae bacterium]